MRFSGDVTAQVHKFSRLDALESFRNPDGSFHFVLVYPQPSASSLSGSGPQPGINGTTYIDWFQMTNPASGSPGQYVSGFTPVFSAYPFTGLRLTSQGSNAYSLMTSGQTSDWQSFSIGQLTPSTSMCGVGICVGAWSTTWVQLYAVAGLGVVMCPAGSYNPSISGSDATACLPCATGTYSNSGSSSCLPCPAGSFCATTVTATACPIGAYSNASWTSCVPCPAGSFASVPGRSSCVTCVAGFYCPANGVTASLVFSHRVFPYDNVAADYFENAQAALSATGNPLNFVHKFSNLSSLESFRNVDGSLHFVLYYPPLPSNALTGTSPPIGFGGLTHNEYEDLVDSLPYLSGFKRSVCLIVFV
jgi:hypothetical protein